MKVFSFTVIGLLVCLLFVSFALYERNDRAYMQEEGLRNEADALLKQLPDPSVYELRKTEAGELYVYCQNHGDATVRPSPDFGSIIVSCGN